MNELIKQQINEEIYQVPGLTDIILLKNELFLI